jgi:hypothetical protein
MSIRITRFSILILAISAIYGRASIVPSLDVSDLAERCDIVAVGRVIEVREVGWRIASSAMRFRLIRAPSEGIVQLKHT